jgi:hypothetical protein
MRAKPNKMPIDTPISAFMVGVPTADESIKVVMKKILRIMKRIRIKAREIFIFCPLKTWLILYYKSLLRYADSRYKNLFCRKDTSKDRSI